MNIYVAVLEAAEARRRRQREDGLSDRERRREDFLRLVKQQIGDTEVHDLVDFQNRTVR